MQVQILLGLRNKGNHDSRRSKSLPYSYGKVVAVAVFFLDYSAKVETVD